MALRDWLVNRKRRIGTGGQAYPFRRRRPAELPAGGYSIRPMAAQKVGRSACPRPRVGGGLACRLVGVVDQAAVAASLGQYVLESFQPLGL